MIDSRPRAGWAAPAARALSAATVLLAATVLPGAVSPAAAAEAAAGRPAGEAAPGRPAARPGPAPPLVLVVGDRFATALADGLDPDPTVVVARTTGDAFGLTRPGYAESLGTIRERLARPDRPALAVMMVGTDDRDPLSDASGRFEPGTPGWARLYGERVDAISALFRDAGVPLVWMGLPAVRSATLSADLVRQNGIIRDRAAKDGASYVDSFDGFTDDAGRYSPVGPDVDGATVKLRRADGLGFTRAGARKLASFLAPEVARLGRSTAAASANDVASLTIDRARGFDAALDIDVNAQIRREAARAAGQPEPAAGPGPASGPAAGPVLPLTAAPTAPDGQLASLAPPQGAPPAAEPATPRPGRADDFSWPRN
ncbi:SGNH/GDSL hydrolase family protein [Lichenibacterium ramalinae]|uniref:DUF459 domain-containing protein n=1 Tax=Lichenibacterium ramalinae TaxID=2316527 RepID=A0A4Q2RF77_9HYPH|nr:DUF459 domain-containing protein [Lichenibacterium ramalinae]RYB04173.1 DUF459 domain-containing protein [Lichenibacterium ramalinae]